MENLNIKRNYDKEPIKIKDINTIFMFLILFPGSIIFTILIFIFNYENMTSKLYINLFILMPVVVWLYVKPYLKYKDSRYIKIYNNKIDFIQDNELLETIKLDEKFTVYKSFEDFYHKSQKQNIYIEIIWLIILPITICNYILLLLSKFFYCLYKSGLKNYHLYDCIIISQDDKIINIYFNSIDEYKTIKDYFLSNFDLDISKSKIFLNKAYHIFEKINF
ncbi:hypothetical protein F1B92_08115 [Campylobacter sp. FMV-PI01]|uniref:Uncharacterized protein n=1 Tax=Campylobacter portucalensis TaxID=2608384 RepID=A0A6L5WMT3_9BACT|nr:hypothetical protein [Campylobacter portucalensis]MSN97123.1 hypothetical protein [Campylobacter portucalensis]